MDGSLFIPLWQIKYAKLLLHLMKSLNALSTLTQSTQIYLLKEVRPVTNTFICGGSEREPCKHGVPQAQDAHAGELEEMLSTYSGNWEDQHERHILVGVWDRPGKQSLKYTAEDSENRP